MRISNYEVNQSAVSKQYRVETSEEKMEVFLVENTTVDHADEIALSKEGLNMVENEDEEFFKLTEEQKAQIRLIEDFVTTLTNRKFRFGLFVKLHKKSSLEKNVKTGTGVATAGKKNGPSASVGIRIEKKNSVYESAQMAFKSSGKVKTADGQSIEFEMNLSMSREYYEEHHQLIQIGARMHDPLVINLDGAGIKFANKSIRIDLDLDGKVDEFRGLTSGSGFLALDKNNNGKIDDGHELFGPESGRGFDELRDYDSDGNQWIDENDAIFNSLKVWILDAHGNEELVGIKEAGLGAIYLGAVASPFEMKEGDNTLGRIADTSIYLRENGIAGAIHELDLKI